MQVSSYKIFAITIVLSIVGLYLIPKLSVRLNPSTTLPSITVSYSLPNASPYVLERDVTSVLESGFSTLRGIKNINSKSSRENGTITLAFDKYTNIDVVRFEVATIVRQLYKKLPERCSYPIISANKFEDDTQQAFISYNINAQESSFQIQQIVETQIEPYLGSISGVDRVVVYGAEAKEYVLTYDVTLFKTLKLSKAEIIEVLETYFAGQSLGQVSYRDEYIKLSLKAQNLNWHIPVKKINNRIFFLDELFAIKEQEKQATSYYRVNGKNAITIAIYARKNTNTILLSNAIDTKIKDIERQLPKNFSVLKSYDSTNYLKTELDKIYERSLYTVFILLAFIFLVSRSVRYLVVVMLSLISNISLAFLFYYAFGLEIQLYSLAGITISLGLIMDNSIVMIDHIKHNGNANVFTSILASTLTTIGALCFIFFLDDKYKINLVDFASVIIINLSVSLLISLFLIPALLRKIRLPVTLEKQWVSLLKLKYYKLYFNIIQFQLRFKTISVIGIVLLFGLPIFMLPKKIESDNTWFERTYNVTFGDDYFRSRLDKYLGGSLRLFSYYVFENAYYGDKEETKLYISASMEKGATVHQMNSVFIEVENFLSQFKEIKQFNTSVYSSDYSIIEVTFENAHSTTAFPFKLKSHLIQNTMDFGGMDWNIYGVGNGFANNSNYNEPVNFSVTAKGYNYNTLNKWADTLKNALVKHPRIQKVLMSDFSPYSKATSYQYKFFLNKERLALAESSPRTIMKELKELTLSKTQDLSININGKYSPIRLESKEAEKYDIWRIKHTLFNEQYQPLNLENIAYIIKEPMEENIYKSNQEYLRLLQFQYTGSIKSGSKFLNKELSNLEASLPMGFSFEASGQELFFKKNNGNNFTVILLLIIGVIYLICSVLFESLTQPFIILSVVPISFIGVFLAFYFSNINFDQGGLASFLLLSGITVNASIFIINQYNSLRKAFPEKDSILLYIEAFKQKIFPILLTVVSTILGFVPFLMEGPDEVFWFALGVGSIGGLVFSLIGILFYLPILTLKRQI